ncbi:hypothetical protein NL676_014050 [Syzygium grande]|nr:hypothetical protein NL676_014050 [Syzygium grande]
MAQGGHVEIVARQVREEMPSARRLLVVGDRMELWCGGPAPPRALPSTRRCHRSARPGAAPGTFGSRLDGQKHGPANSKPRPPRRLDGCLDDPGDLERPVEYFTKTSSPFRFSYAVVLFAFPPPPPPPPPLAAECRRSAASRPPVLREASEQIRVRRLVFDLECLPAMPDAKRAVRDAKKSRGGCS